jgi:hypothetical protein
LPGFLSHTSALFHIAARFVDTNDVEAAKLGDWKVSSCVTVLVCVLIEAVLAKAVLLDSA